MESLESIRTNEASSAQHPVVVALGGSTRAESTTARALRFCLEAIEEFGARSILLEFDDLQLPFYTPQRSHRTTKARRLVEALRAADALIVATPGYHRSISGLVKNALDYAEDLRDDARPYLDGVPVGCIVCASGPQATVTTLVALRSVVHALPRMARAARRDTRFKRTFVGRTRAVARSSCAGSTCNPRPADCRLRGRCAGASNQRHKAVT